MRLHAAAPTPCPGNTTLQCTNQQPSSNCSSTSQLRRASQFEASRSSSILGTVWASYFFIFIAICLTFSIVFAVGFYINSMSAKHLSNDVSTSMSAERILGAKIFDREENSQENDGHEPSLVVVEKLRKMF
uniref:Uncharacterized protein n=1 Tax=Ditylenchus dipsaci TaxID=166011 RepID=A0A915DI50_9BILA